MTKNNNIKKKILLLLLAGTVLSFSYSPSKQRKIFKELSKEWKNIDKNKLYYYINEFYNDRLIDYKELDDGSIKIIILEKGEKKVLLYNIDEIVLKKPNQWDKKWRLVLFDIPESIRKGRDALRNKLKDLGFYELQKSVFVHPYPCEDEINFIVEVFNLRSYVKIAEISKITNEENLKLHFKLY